LTTFSLVQQLWPFISSPEQNAKFLLFDKYDISLIGNHTWDT